MPPKLGEELRGGSEARSRPYVALAPQIRGSEALELVERGANGVKRASKTQGWGSTDIVVTTPVKFCEDLERSKEDRFYPACVVMDEAGFRAFGDSQLLLWARDPGERSF